MNPTERMRAVYMAEAESLVRLRFTQLRFVPANDDGPHELQGFLPRRILDNGGWMGWVSWPG